jgi:uncharacterized zinc-type alcohol dehydrogenase-like protein
MFSCTGYAAQEATAPLSPFSFNRRDTGPTDVRIEILFCGVCHSDLHTARNEWHFTTYPNVPGHEIVGIVTEVGGSVTKYKVGDRVGVGCMVDSCRSCESCQEGLEQYCEKGNTGTYNSPDKDFGHTFGGYSSHIVVEQDFVLSIPDNLDFAAAAPLLCAGITTFSPLRHWKAGPGKRVGIAGIGGLGHMGVKLAHAMGAHVTVITTSASKIADAKALGADEVILSTDPEQMKSKANSLDLIIDCISADHSVDHYASLIKRDGALVLVGAPEKPLSIAAFTLLAKRRSFAGSGIGGIAETQEMLDFCSAHNVLSDIETIPIQKINDAYERMLKGDVKYRFVIDMASLKAA